MRERFNAIKTHWAGKKGPFDGALTLLVFLGAAIVVSLVVYYWISYRKTKRRKEQEEMAFQKKAKESGLTQNEVKLLVILAAGVPNKKKHRLIQSISRFDESAGAYLKRYCSQKAHPEPVLKALDGLRKKLTNASGNESSQDSKGRAGGGSGSGPEDLPILSKIELWNLTAKGAEHLAGFVVENTGGRIRIIPPGGRLQFAWEKGDVLKIKRSEGLWNSIELLAKFNRVESEKTGLFLVESESLDSSAPGEKSGRIIVEQPVRLFREGCGQESAILEWFDMDGACLKNAPSCKAGERIELELGLADYGIRERISGKVIFCRNNAGGLPSIGVRFEGHLMKENAESATLSPKLQRLIDSRK